MKKAFLLLFLLFIIAIPASAANLFCPNCSDPNLSPECGVACQNQLGQASVCQCEGSMVSFPSSSSLDCDTNCAGQYGGAPTSETLKPYKVCNCSTQIQYAESNECHTPCGQSEFTNKLACICKESTVGASEVPAADADNQCKEYCEKAAAQTTPASPTAPDTEQEPAESITQKAPKLFVQIPGINLSDIQVSTTGTGKINVPWISQNIIGIYKYSMGFAAILSVIVVMIAGFMYLTSAGNPQRIGQAKNFIIGAITGLVILASSYLILNLISPQLTELGTIEIEEIEGTDIGDLQETVAPANSELTPEELDSTLNPPLAPSGPAVAEGGYPYYPNKVIRKGIEKPTAIHKRRSKWTPPDLVIIHSTGGQQFLSPQQKSGFGVHYFVDKNGDIFQQAKESQVAHGVGTDTKADYRGIHIEMINLGGKCAGQKKEMRQSGDKDSLRKKTTLLGQPLIPLSPYTTAPNCNPSKCCKTALCQQYSKRYPCLEIYPEEQLRATAKLTAEIAKRHGIPILRPVEGDPNIYSQFKWTGQAGIIGHTDVNDAGHADPLPSFPWGHFMDLVKQYY